ncbi:hypothetical protein K438DRAFT_703481 [Mycena galopus ATCC 62051]|nr:hypothetical protein K438DRAFT_703481 [Mycena galopus ATCC 62051]
MRRRQRGHEASGKSPNSPTANRPQGRLSPARAPRPRNYLLTETSVRLSMPCRRDYSLTRRLLIGSRSLRHEQATSPSFLAPDVEA